MDGHGASVGGAIVDAGRFDWLAHAERFPGLTQPDESYHGVVYALSLIHISAGPCRLREPCANREPCARCGRRVAQVPRSREP